MDGHFVDMREPSCDCGYFIWNERECKHIYRARLYLGDVDAFKTLAEVLAAL